MLDELLGHRQRAGVESGVEGNDIAPSRFGRGESAELAGVEPGGAAQHVGSAHQRGELGPLAHERREAVHGERQAVGVETFVGDRGSDDGDLGHRRIELGDGVERLVEPASRQRDAGGEDSRLRVDGAVGDGLQRGAPRERVVAGLEGERAEPGRHARRVRRGEAPFDGAARFGRRVFSMACSASIAFGTALRASGSSSRWVLASAASGGVLRARDRAPTQGPREPSLPADRAISCGKSARGRALCCDRPRARRRATTSPGPGRVRVEIDGELEAIDRAKIARAFEGHAREELKVGILLGALVPLLHEGGRARGVALSDERADTREGEVGLGDAVCLARFMAVSMP